MCGVTIGDAACIEVASRPVLVAKVVCLIAAAVMIIALYVRVVRHVPVVSALIMTAYAQGLAMIVVLVDRACLVAAIPISIVVTTHGAAQQENCVASPAANFHVQKIILLRPVAQQVIFHALHVSVYWIIVLQIII